MKIYETWLKNLPKFKESHPKVKIEIVTRTVDHPCAPSKGLLGDFVRCKNKLRTKNLTTLETDEGKTISDIIHNRAWDYVDYHTRYLEEICHSDKVNKWLDSTVKEGNDLVLVCYEKPPKKCHRHILKGLLEKHAELNV